MAKDSKPTNPIRTTIQPIGDGHTQASQNSGQTSENAKTAQEIVNQNKNQPNK